MRTNSYPYAGTIGRQRHASGLLEFLRDGEVRSSTKSRFASSVRVLGCDPGYQRSEIAGPVFTKVSWFKQAARRHLRAVYDVVVPLSVGRGGEGVVQEQYR